MNRIQFQKGLSRPEFQSQYGTEEQCEAALAKTRRPDGYQCSLCQSTVFYVLHVRSRKTFMCGICNPQTSPARTCLSNRPSIKDLFRVFAFNSRGLFCELVI
ncbi:MAG: transposase [Leptospirillum sp.]